MMKSSAKVKIVKKDVTKWIVYIPEDVPEEVNNIEFLKEALENAINKMVDKINKEEERKESPHHHTNRLD